MPKCKYDSDISQCGTIKAWFTRMSTAQGLAGRDRAPIYKAFAIPRATQFSHLSCSETRHVAGEASQQSMRGKRGEAGPLQHEHGCGMTVNLLGAVSRDEVCGSKYSGNSTRGSSTAVFGNIGRALFLSEKPYTDLSKLTTTALDDHRLYDADSRPNDEHSSRRNTLSGTPRSHEREFHDQHNRSKSLSLYTDETLRDHMQHQGRSSTPHRAPSPATEEPIITCSEPDQKIYRQYTAPLFGEGKVFDVDPWKETRAEHAAETGRLILVMGRTESSVLCLTLRRHKDVQPLDDQFLRTRVSLYTKRCDDDDGRAQVVPEHFKQCPCAPLAIKLEEGRELFQGVWVNLAEPQTIKDVAKIAVSYHGNLDHGDFVRLKDAYIATQIGMLRPSQRRRNMLIVYLLMLLAFLIVQVWLFSQGRCLVGKGLCVCSRLFPCPSLSSSKNDGLLVASYILQFFFC